MLQVAWAPYRLQFKFEAKTSRATMTYKDTYFVKVWDSSAPEVYGLGECALFRGLSADDVADYEMRLSEVCRNVGAPLPQYSSIIFGVETALRDLANGGVRQVYPGRWSRGEERIPINGLIWMGDRELMAQRIAEKLNGGFKCLKLKIGGIQFESEVELLRAIRQRFSADVLEVRLDANGAFTPSNALERLDVLSKFDIHSIEQPIKAGQVEAMAEICRKSPIDIALDEELIGCRSTAQKQQLLDDIKPKYIILKPALCGGLDASGEWATLAEKSGIGWWATSALESNIGLNAIAQWVSARGYNMPQGLGTGALYHNNIQSPVSLDGSAIVYNTEKQWLIPEMQWRKA